MSVLRKMEVALTVLTALTLKAHFYVAVKMDILEMEHIVKV